MFISISPTSFVLTAVPSARRTGECLRSLGGICLKQCRPVVSREVIVVTLRPSIGHFLAASRLPNEPGKVASLRALLRMKSKPRIHESHSASKLLKHALHWGPGDVRGGEKT